MPAKKTPSYRLHKPSGRAAVTLDGRDYEAALARFEATLEATDSAEKPGRE